MKITVNSQQVASITRQILALVAIVVGQLTQGATAWHLPIANSTALTLIGGGLLWIEHYVGDPSTGTPVPPAPPVP